MEEASPLIAELLEQVRKLALKFEGAEEYFPWGDRSFKANDRIFVSVNAHGDYLSINVRPVAGEREAALQLPFVQVAKYTGHRGWITAKVRNKQELNLVLPWIQMSYDLNNFTHKPNSRTKAKKD